MVAFAVNKPADLEKIMRKIAPLPDEGTGESVFDRVREDDGGDAEGEFVKNWWPDGGLPRAADAGD